MVAERNPKQESGAPLSMIHTPRKRHFQQALRDVLGRLLCENRLAEDDLGGLREEKMKSIAQFLRDDAA